MAKQEQATRVRIDGLGAGGDGVGRLPNGRVVFVEGALPGDLVLVAPGERKKKVQHADLLELLEPSPERVQSRCHSEACGGCALQTYSMAGQAAAKRTRIVETLRRIGKVDVAALLGSVGQFGDGWGYRQRVRLHGAWRADQWEIGFHARRSRTVVPFAGCPTLVPQLDEAARRAATHLQKLRKSARLEEVELAYSQRDDRVAMSLIGGASVTPFRDIADWLEETGISGVDVRAVEGHWQWGNIELRYDHAKADQFDLRFEPGIFTQAYPEANDRLVKAVERAVRPRETPRVLELHAGIGNFSIPLGRAGARIAAVERDRRAVILCRRNARRAGLSLTAVEMSDIEALGGIEVNGEHVSASDFDVLLLDPPRSGAAEVMRVIAERGGPPRIVYVSCDPATLARDAATLTGAGYILTHIEAYDMFPQTPHVEVLSVFVRRDP